MVISLYKKPLRRVFGPSLLFITMVFFLAGISPADASDKVSALKKVWLEAIVVPPNSLRQSDEIPRLRLLIHNESDTPIWVNKRMLWGPISYPSVMREVILDISDPKGNKVEFNCRIRSSEVGLMDYVLLKPEGLVGVDILLNRCVRFLPNERYKIVARYIDGNNPSGLSNLFPRLQTELKSAAVEFYITSPIEKIKRR